MATDIHTIATAEKIVPGLRKLCVYYTTIQPWNSWNNWVNLAIQVLSAYTCKSHIASSLWIYLGQDYWQSMQQMPLESLKKLGIICLSWETQIDFMSSLVESHFSEYTYLLISVTDFAFTSLKREKTKTKKHSILVLLIHLPMTKSANLSAPSSNLLLMNQMFWDIFPYFR